MLIYVFTILISNENNTGYLRRRNLNKKQAEILSVCPYISPHKLLRADLDKILFWRSALIDTSANLISDCIGLYLQPLHRPKSFQPSYGNCPYNSTL
jgi:hypothetical protein